MHIAEFIQCHPSNHTRGRGGRKVDGMAVHYTGTGASAHNNLVYFSRGGAAASAHLFVDKDGAIRQSVRLEDTAWAVGDFAENQRTVSVEVVSAGEDFTDAQVAALAEIYRHLREKYGIARVIRHYDVTGKRCPAPYVDEAKWAALKARITGGGGQPAPAPQPQPSDPAQLAVDGFWGPSTTKRAQQLAGLVADGEVWHQHPGNKGRLKGCTGGWKFDGSLKGSPLIRWMQANVLHIKADGIAGKDFANAMIRKYGNGYTDGKLDGPSVAIKGFQKALNEGRF